MLLFFSGVYEWGLSVSSKNIQHIQHIQHFPRKKHIFRNRTKNTFNIFNITAERCTFSNKTSYSCNVECCWFFFWGFRMGSVSLKNIQHIQHIQHFPRKKHIFRNTPRTYSTYSTFWLKQRFLPFLCLKGIVSAFSEHFY